MRTPIGEAAKSRPAAGLQVVCEPENERILGCREESCGPRPRIAVQR